MVRHAEIHVSSLLSEKDWDVLDLFCEQTKRLAATKLVSDGHAEIREKIRYEQGKGLWFESELPPEEQIAEFLMVFRLFYQQKEPTHLPKILKLIERHTNSPDARQICKIIRKQWNDFLFAKIFNIRFNDTPITSSLLLDLWFNAHYFHSDKNKKRELNKLKDGLSAGFAKYMLLDAAFEASKIVLKVFDGVRGIVDEHFSV